MPRARHHGNAFTAREVYSITGLSLHMINYLRRYDFLTPCYGDEVGRRGKVRYYSYRDLVVAKLIQHLRLCGVELKTVKEAVVSLRDSAHWNDLEEGAHASLRLLRTDGKNVFIEKEEGFLEYLRSDRQTAFSFLVNINSLASQVRECIPPGIRKNNFSLLNKPLIETKRQRKTG